MFFDLIFLGFVKWLANITGSHNADGRSGDTFIPFEDQCNHDPDDGNGQDQTPADFDDWGDF
jgi:hypothetical protein